MGLIRGMLFAAVAALAPWLPAAAQNAEAAFEAADVNGDGMVNVDEYVAWFVRVFRDIDAEDRGFLTAGQLQNVNAERFASADRDGDGRISLSEAIADRMMLFFDVDGDENGVLSLSEVEAFSATQ